MSELFGRTVIIQLGDEKIGRSYEDLKVSFSVEKTLKSEPNKADIEIYGLSRTSIAQYLAANTDLRVRLFAGYNGAPSLIFEGYPVKKEGLVFTPGPPDSILKIKAKDGVRRFERARVNIARTDEMKFEDVLIEVASSLGLPPDTIDVPPDIRLTQGATLSGQAEDILDRLALAANADWSVQDGKFQFIARRSARAGQGPVFSSELRNVVGAARRKDKGIELTTFIQGTVVPGGLFRYVSETSQLNGDYKIHKVRYRGDSRGGGEFYAVIEGRDYESAAERERLNAQAFKRIEDAAGDFLVTAANTLGEVLYREGQVYEEDEFVNDFGN